MSKNTIIFSSSSIITFALLVWFWVLVGGLVGFEGTYIEMNIFPAIGALIGALAFAGLGFLIAKKQQGHCIAVIPAISFVLVFYREIVWDNVLAIMMVVAIVVGIVGYAKTNSEKSQRIKLTTESAKNGVRGYFVAVILLLTLMLYQASFAGGEIKLSEDSIRIFAPIVEKQIKSQMPFYSSDMPIEEMLVVSALSSGEITLSQKSFSRELQAKIQEKIAEKGQQSMDKLMEYPEIQQLVIRDAVKSNPQMMEKLRSEYGEKFGIKIAPEQSIIKTITDIANSYIEKFVAPFKDYLPIALAVSLFLGFKAVEFIFVGIAIGLSGALFALLKSGAIIQIIKKETTQETLE